MKGFKEAQAAYDNQSEPEPLTEWELEAQADDMADQIWQRAHQGAVAIQNREDRLAWTVGYLRAEIRTLCGRIVWGD